MPNLPRKPLTYRSQENPDFALWSEYGGPRNEPRLWIRVWVALAFVALAIAVADVGGVVPMKDGGRYER